MTSRKALIIMGHGSREASANEEFSGYAQQVAAMNATDTAPHYQHVGAAFLEFSPQTLMQACKRAVNDGCTIIDVYPVFLTLGKHVGRDIPQQVAEITDHFPTVRANLLEHMGASVDLSTLILDHITLQLRENQRLFH